MTDPQTGTAYRIHVVSGISILTDTTTFFIHLLFTYRYHEQASSDKLGLVVIHFGCKMEPDNVTPATSWLAAVTKVS